MSPDVSVVVSTFRRPAQLVEAVRSALAQEDVWVEVLVVDDDGSDDARRAVQRLCDTRVRYVRMPSPSGGKPARVRNVGWPRTRAPLVHFLDDDDRVPPGAYRSMLEAFRAHPDRGVVFGRVSPFGVDARAVEAERARFEHAYRRARLARAIDSRHFMVANVLFLRSFLITSACMIRRECVEALDGWDPDMAVFEDVDFYARAIRRFGCVFLDEVVLEYRISPSSIMHGDLGRPELEGAYARMHERYKRAWGSAEFFGMKLLARGVLRPLYETILKPAA
jgi:glycosyltransferase involved in cell wall biosynthesis